MLSCRQLPSPAFEDKSRWLMYSELQAKDAKSQFDKQ